jgi:hypothetical protein
MYCAFIGAMIWNQNWSRVLMAILTRIMMACSIYSA